MIKIQSTELKKALMKANKYNLFKSNSYKTLSNGRISIKAIDITYQENMDMVFP